MKDFSHVYTIRSKLASKYKFISDIAFHMYDESYVVNIYTYSSTVKQFIIPFNVDLLEELIILINSDLITNEEYTKVVRSSYTYVYNVDGNEYTGYK